MARLTLRPQQALVIVVCLVASDTGARRLPLGRRLEVATCACRCLVGARQGETGFGMIEGDGFPVLRCMTIRARSAILAFVNVVFPVAGDAVGWGRIGLTCAVARRTLRNRMLADQLEAGLVVIEPGLGPAGGVVTRGAVCSECTFVDIVSLVAINAFRLQTCPDLILVARVAGRALVLAQERKICGCVVKPDRFPVGNRVTVCAGSAQPAQVRLVALVAGHATRRRLRKGHARFVAACAVSLLVAAHQGIVSEIVIKRRRLETHDIRAATDMLGVAGLAFCAFHIRPLPVKPRLRLYVRADLGVAINTEAGLRLLVERLVAK